MTTISQILEWPDEYKGGGFDLTIKTVKKMTKIGETWYQDVMFTDGKDDIYGRIKLNGNIPFQRNTLIRVIVGIRMTYDVNNRDVPGLYVDQWSQPTMTADEWEQEQTGIKAEWNKEQEHRIRGMVRHGLVCAYRKKHGFDEPLDNLIKELINRDVDFIIEGS